MLTKDDAKNIVEYFKADGLEKERLGFKIYPAVKQIAYTVVFRYFSTSYKKYGDIMVDAAISRFMCSKINTSEVGNIYNYCFTSFRNSYLNFVKLKMNKLNYINSIDYLTNI